MSANVHPTKVLAPWSALWAGMILEYALDHDVGLLSGRHFVTVLLSVEGEKREKKKEKERKDERKSKRGSARPCVPRNACRRNLPKKSTGGYFPTASLGVSKRDRGAETLCGIIDAS